MEDAERITHQKILIEKIGCYLEKQGYQPIGGRILGLLMVMDKEEYTFDEIVSEMQISKSSASTALKNLELRNAIEYVTYPGDRKRYFRLSFLDINFIIEEVERKIKAYSNFFDHIIKLKKNHDSKNSIMIKKMMTVTTDFLTALENFKNENN